MGGRRRGKVGGVHWETALGRRPPRGSGGRHGERAARSRGSVPRGRGGDGPRRGPGSPGRGRAGSASLRRPSAAAWRSPRSASGEPSSPGRLAGSKHQQHLQRGSRVQPVCEAWLFKRVRWCFCGVSWRNPPRVPAGRAAEGCAGSGGWLCSRGSAPGAVVGPWEADEGAGAERSLPTDLHCKERFPKRGRTPWSRQRRSARCHGCLVVGT